MRQQYIVFAALFVTLVLIATGIVAAAKFSHPSQPGNANETASPLLALPSQASGSLPVLGQATTVPQRQPNQPQTFPGAIETDASQSAHPETAHKVQVTLTSGKSFTIAVYDDLAPKTVENFLNKASSNFYNGLLFFRVEKDQQGNPVVAQTGDPTNTGSGGGVMQAEYNKRPFTVGSIGIARGQNRDKNSDSQFFITLQDSPGLMAEYTNFGDVIEGIDVVKNIHQGQPILSTQVIE